MSERSVLTKSMSWDWVTNGDGAPGRRVARRAARILPAARRGLVTVPSFADAGVVRCSPVPHRGFAGGPFQGQGAGPGFGPGAGERHVGSSSSVSDAGRGVPRGVSVLMVILGMRPTVGPPARERIMETWDLWPAARRAAGGAPGPGCLPPGWSGAGRRGENGVVGQGAGSGAADRPVLAGRVAELREVERLLAPSAAPRGRVLVVCGEPGIGKSTVWQAGVGLARSQGFAVWSARPGEAEAQLSFAGLADLLDGAGAEVLAGLPVPQRWALEVAVRRAEPDLVPPEPLAIAAGLLGVLRAAASVGPVLVAVDDLPWLDGASAAAVVFAARRLAGEDVRFLVSRRSGRDSELERAAGPAGVVRVELGSLSFGAISGLLADRLTAPLPRRVARQVFEVSGGNPLFALELGRAVLERGVPEIGAGLPVPALIGELFAARVEALRPDVRRVLLAEALSAGLSAKELAAVVDPLAVEDAEASGVLVADGTRVRAAHPLLAAAASGQSTARERRALHAALGAAVSDPVLRARHRALAASGPDARLAGEVSAAADQAAGRGAVQDAAELAGHALRLTAAGDSHRDGRLLALARYLIDAGEHPRAARLLAGWVGTLPAGPTRAAAHLLLGEGADIPAEEEHVALAIADSTTDPGLHAQALARRAIVVALDRVRRI